MDVAHAAVAAQQDGQGAVGEVGAETGPSQMGEGEPEVPLSAAVAGSVASELC